MTPFVFTPDEITVFKLWLINEKVEKIASKTELDRKNVIRILRKLKGEVLRTENYVDLLEQMKIIEPLPNLQLTESGKREFRKRQQPTDANLSLGDVKGEGFAQDFLPVRIELPELTEAYRQEAYIVNGSEVTNYTHFSLALNKLRRLAFWVGWNIDGGNLKKLSRKGISFILDPNIPFEFQVGRDGIYEGNRLVPSQIARRIDLLWGELAEAEKANRDSFFYTNNAPRYNSNQFTENGLWDHLEDNVFENNDIENLRVSIFGGPIFRENDHEFRGLKIPREYWKAILFVEDQKLKAKGFLLSQNLDELEAMILDEFRVWQVALTEIEDRCGLRFSAALKAADTTGSRMREKILRERKPLSSPEDIDWS